MYFLCTVLYKSSTSTVFLWASQIALIQLIYCQGYTVLFLDRMHLLFTQMHFLFWPPGRVVGQYTTLLNTNCSIQYYSFVCTLLNGSKYCYVSLTIQLNSHLFFRALGKWWPGIRSSKYQVRFIYIVSPPRVTHLWSQSKYLESTTVSGHRWAGTHFGRPCWSVYDLVGSVLVPVAVGRGRLT